MGVKYRHLTFSGRLKIEAYIKAKHTIKEISGYLGVSRQTIYNELKRGTYEHLNSDLTTDIRYSPDIAQERYRNNLAAKGAALKIGNDIRYAEWLEHMIVDNNYSPAAALACGEASQFDIRICATTLYSYIDKGLFLRLTNKALPVKRHKDKKKHKYLVRKKAASGKSIEQRADEVLRRDVIGHWEMDTVVGKRGKSKHSLLVLTERKTRYELIMLLKEHTTSAVVEQLDNLEIKYGDAFSSIFKTITCDNGTEFSAVDELEKSCCHSGTRTALYYAHPYSSYERGSNENNNKLIRRFIPKGTNFDNLTQDDINVIQHWINHYPRKLLGWHSASDLYAIEAG